MHITDTIYRFVTYAIILVIMFSYLLIGFVAIETYSENYNDYLNINEYYTRIIYVIITVIIAIVNPIPLTTIMLCSILGVTILNLIIPACVQLCLLDSGEENDGKLKCWCYILIFVGIVLFVVGLYSVYFGVMVELKLGIDNIIWLQ